MTAQQKYIKVLQKIKQKHADELSNELKEEINSLLEAKETVLTPEHADKIMSVVVKALIAIEKIQDWF